MKQTAPASVPDTPAASPAATIHAQIYGRFRAMIETGQLKPGQRVSSLRALAEELGVARGTVQVAFDRLLGEGYLVARGPAGTFVAEHITAAPARARAARKAPAVTTPLIAAGTPPKPARPAAPRFATSQDATEVVIESGGGAPAMLQLGVPALDEFPRKLWTRLMTGLVRSVNTLNRPAPFGYEPLREALATYLHSSRGIDLRPAQVFVVPAYTAGLELAVNALELRGGKGAWAESPGYPPTAQLLRRLGLPPLFVPVDECGVDVEYGIAHHGDACLAVVTPSHQSPTGVPLTLQRRVALLDWAARRGAWIVEDDYDGEFRYRGHPLPALKSLDTCQRVIYCGTLSKVMFPGLRLGYVVVPESQIEAFEVAIARATFGGCPELMQAAVAEFITAGHFSRHIKRMRTLYARRRTLLADALRAYEPHGFRVQLEDGGMHLLLDVPDDRDDIAMARLAQEAGFGIHSLTGWRRGKPGRRALLLGFTNVATQAEAERMVTKLMRALGEPRT